MLIISLRLFLDVLNSNNIDPACSNITLKNYKYMQIYTYRAKWIKTFLDNEEIKYVHYKIFKK